MIVDDIAGNDGNDWNATEGGWNDDDVVVGDDDVDVDGDDDVGDDGVDVDVDDDAYDAAWPCATSSGKQHWTSQLHKLLQYW